MDIKTIAKPIYELDADTLLIYLFENNTDFGEATAAVDRVLNGHIRELTQSGDFSGELGKSITLYPRDQLTAQRVIISGLGKIEDFNLDVLRQAVATGIQRAKEAGTRHVATGLAGTGEGGFSAIESARAIVEGALLTLYQYDGQKSSIKNQTEIGTLELLAVGVETGIAEGRAFAAGANLARDLVNLPPNICTPTYLAERASEMATAAGLHCEILGEQQIQALKMGAFLGVAQGSDQPLKFVILEHNSDRADELDTIVLVGKGVTFDTGGYSLKTRDGMVGMKSDMAGAAAVIGALRTIAGLHLPLHVVGLVPTVDNMVSGHAYRPQDVLTASNGKTIEVISTDAEGRLLLADALVYAGRYSPVAVIDIATLTGACIVALGHAAAGLFSTDDTLRDRLMAAGEYAQERVWPLPLYRDYRKVLESETADMKNTGGRLNGVGTSAMFLKEFTDYPAWAHIDIAGLATDLKDIAYVPSTGASGFGSRLMAQMVKDWTA